MLRSFRLDQEYGLGVFEMVIGLLGGLGVFRKSTTGVLLRAGICSTGGFNSEEKNN